MNAPQPTEASIGLPTDTGARYQEGEDAMRSAGYGFVFKRAALVLACMAVVAIGGALRADDFEDPIMPDSLGMPVSIFGDVEVEPDGVGGAWIDAREALEPVMSVLLMTGAVNTSPGMAVKVDVSPVFECQAPEETP